MNTVRILQQPTYIEIESGQFTTLPNGASIHKTIEFCKDFEFNKNLNKWVLRNRYYLYNPNKKSFRLPRHLLGQLTTELNEQNFQIEIDDTPTYTPRKVVLKMKSTWTDRPEHEVSINHLIDKTIPMRCCNMQTGKGKTYCAIKSICILRQATLIVCDGILVNQWKNELLEKTTIKEEDIYIIKGANSVIRAMGSDIHPSVFIASIDTLRNFVRGETEPYSDLPSYQSFLEYFGIGIKIFDEFHLNFAALMTIDLRSNVQNNLYLSATPKRNIKSEKRIFDTIFPISIIKGGGAYDKYVDIKFFKYCMDVGRESRFSNKYGYSHAKYESYIANTPKIRQYFIKKILVPRIDAYYINEKLDGQKLLIFVATVSFCQMLQRYLQFEYPDLSVNTYTAEDPDENLTQSDIIISTPLSCGVGKDIKDLRTVIQTISFKSEPQIEQVLGRLRKLEDTTPIFIDIYNSKMSSHNWHYQTRTKIYRNRAKHYTEFYIP